MDCTIYEADLRLCFRLCKKPVFSQRGSFKQQHWRLLSSCFRDHDFVVYFMLKVVGNKIEDTI